MTPHWAILRTYFMCSWLGVVYTIGMLGLCYWTSFQVERIEPVLLMAYFLMSIISSRLSALTTYSMAFNAPDYLRHHYQVAIGLLAVFVWVPPIFISIWHGQLVEILSFLSLLTGFVFLGEKNAPRLYFWGSGIIFTGILLLILFQLPPAWAPGDIVGPALLIIGAIMLTIHFRRNNKEEYNTFVNTISMVHYSQWVKERIIADPNNNQIADKLNKPGFVERVASRYKLNPQSPGALLKMTNLGSGDWLQWQIVWFISVVSLPWSWSFYLSQT